LDEAAMSWFQSPRGDFGFLKTNDYDCTSCSTPKFQSPRGDFGFLKLVEPSLITTKKRRVSIPSRGFWFFEGRANAQKFTRSDCEISIPSRGFWFFEVTALKLKLEEGATISFNPLAGILVF
jgi:hypothetical protein